jgi:hypothetical protein
MHITKQERHMRKKQRKHEERKKEQRNRKMKKARNAATIVLFVSGGIFALGWYVVSRPSLPPISTQNHSEQSPPSHIVSRPIPDAIQRHMLEHADGRGAPGVIIQYNCNDFDCEPDLIQKLVAVAELYADRVYLASNNNDGKIILTKLGQRKILDVFDEQAIRIFIER